MSILGILTVCAGTPAGNIIRLRGKDYTSTLKLNIIITGVEVWEDNNFNNYNNNKGYKKIKVAKLNKYYSE